MIRTNKFSLIPALALASGPLFMSAFLSGYLAPEEEAQQNGNLAEYPEDTDVRKVQIFGRYRSPGRNTSLSH
ncbi:hypothetical protein FTO70_06465 [Methanosarcina sp. KYL-1]|nr:hypothetical protein [Methanosarcina sp. KYL-1]